MATARRGGIAACGSRRARPGARRCCRRLRPRVTNSRSMRTVEGLRRLRPRAARSPGASALLPLAAAMRRWLRRARRYRPANACRWLVSASRAACEGRWRSRGPAAGVAYVALRAPRLSPSTGRGSCRTTSKGDTSGGAAPLRQAASRRAQDERAGAHCGDLDAVPAISSEPSASRSELRDTSSWIVRELAAPASGGARPAANVPSSIRRRSPRRSAPVKRGAARRRSDRVHAARVCRAACERPRTFRGLRRAAVR